MNFSRFRLVLVGIAGMVAVTAGACSQPTQGTASPTPSGSSQSGSPASSRSETAEAPKVPAPVNVDKFLADPCSMLTPAQLSALQLSQPKADKASSGVGCGWRFSDGYTPSARPF